MEKYSIELLPAAFEDLDEIFDYILLDDPKSAEHMLDNIMTSLNRLEEFPNSGVKVIDDFFKHYNFRMIIIDPYIAFYRIINSTVYIYRILHGARDYIQVLKNIK